MLVPLGAEDTKWGICVHKVGDLCTQSGGFVGATLRSSALTPVCVRDRPLLNDWQMDALYYAQYAPIPNFATLPRICSTFNGISICVVPAYGLFTIVIPSILRINGSRCCKELNDKVTRATIDPLFFLVVPCRSVITSNCQFAQVKSTGVALPMAEAQI